MQVSSNSGRSDVNLQRKRLKNVQSIAVGTSNANPCAVIDATSTSKGVLVPRLTSDQIRAIPSPVSGLILYNTTTNTIDMFDGQWKALQSMGDIKFEDNVIKSVENVDLVLSTQSMTNSVVMDRKLILQNGKLATPAAMGLDVVSGGDVDISTTKVGGGSVNFFCGVDLKTNNLSGVNSLSATTINAQNISATTLSGTLDTGEQSSVTALGVQSRNLNMGGNGVTEVSSISTSGSSFEIRSGGDVDVLANGGLGSINVWSSMDVKTNDINNVGTVRATTLEGTLASSVQGNVTEMPGLVSINGKGVPSSNFVGVSDAQTLTNKTIDGSQIVDHSMPLRKIAPVTELSLVGNPSTSSATPEAVSMATLKIMGNLVDAAILTSWTGSSTVSTLSSTVNGLTLPSSNFVGVSDAQTLTNKTIDGSQIVDQSLVLGKLAPVTALSLVGNSSASSAVPGALTPAQVKAMLDISDQQAVTLDGDVTGSGTGTVSTIIASNSVSLEKMATLSAKCIIGNSTAVAATPQALSTSSVRSLLSLANVENTALSTWPGSTNITTIAPNSVSLENMGTLAANTIIGNNTGVSATPQALSATDVKSLLALNNVENTALSTWPGSTNINTLGSLTSVNTGSITSPGNLTITPNFGAGNVQIWSPLDMKTNSISNVGTLNALTLPISNLVGVNDAQTLTNKTIDSSQIVNSSVNGSQIVYQSLPLDKVIPLSAFTLIGNNTEASAAPTALTSFEAKTLLALNNVENTALSTWNGSNNITTLGTISTLNVSNINSSGTLAITPSGG